MDIDPILLDKILKDLDIKPTEKIDISGYIEKISSVINEDEDFDNLSMFHLLSAEMNQEESTVRKKLTRTINKNEDAIKNKLNIDKKPTPKTFVGWLISKVKK